MVDVFDRRRQAQNQGDDFWRVTRRIGYGVTGFIGFIVFITVVFGSWYTVQQTERAVLTTNGALSAVVGPGLHYKWPWVQSVRTFPVTQQVARFDGAHAYDHGAILDAYSRDQQPAKLTVSVNWHIPADQVDKVYANYGDLDILASRSIWRISPQQVKTIFGQFDAQSVIQERARFNAEVASAVETAIGLSGAPVIVDSVQVENIDFSNVYEQAVEQRMQQQVAVEKQRQVLETEKISAEIALTQATGRANSVKAQADADAYKTKALAEADAYATQINGEASAKAIEARSKALVGNPLLVEQTKAERWDGKLPVTMLPDSAVPFLTNVK